MIAKTGSGWVKTRAAVLARDEQACRKCGRHDILEVHHIQPKHKGGSDADANLVTLCHACHVEWGMMEEAALMGFFAWLSVPVTAVQLVILFSHAEMWRDDTTAAAMRDFLIQAAMTQASASGRLW